MRTSLKGHSGAEITTDFLSVYKKVNSSKEYERLVMAASKQLTFADTAHLKTSKTIGFNWNERELKFNYILNDCIVDFIGKSSLKDSAWFFNAIHHYINDNVLHSGWSMISSSVIAKKCASVEEAINKNPKLSQNQKGRARICLDFALQLSIPAVRVPMGECHGDLTFSNMLIQPEKCYLIDFLDCWLESPIMDLAKLQQEIDLGWTLRMKELHDSDHTPYIVKTHEMVTSIIHRIKVDHPDIRHSLKIATIMNHLRLLQYENCTQWAERILDKTEVLCSL